ncbi:DNA-binding MarR family transcriptional regulator [Aquimarina sp. MAR_2010_214]|uniref:MarR family winged helix-turn-helix transcriptional regulator n=1 Tax=Aquimarina sp. MAR_2010_214 TaxID=1250026 RepID=UPI000C707FAD|nr:MarR family transcriptional regulator [Aquimarina sp. MAR_2010_214]PKV51149.1 DNA-binding MarR family transcriptional regulator [Aquimarina sp. MAR_2010_214]
MAEDIVSELGYMALGTRLKRISDKMSHSSRMMYKKLNIEFEPNWYLVFLIIKNKPGTSVMEIASSLGFAHQTVMVMTSKMVKKGYLKVSKGEKDKRKTVFHLTTKANEILPKIEQVWEAGKKVVYELLEEDITIMKHIEKLEQNLKELSFGERIIDKLK